ncbi:DUF6153 family protein [Streptomyces sp. NPDC048384]|uniref:DUF6153 family protein n=1 Tax=Streptomyces sp. NPDC048384 TaxID=3155487 RepID=UPI00343B11BD
MTARARQDRAPRIPLPGPWRMLLLLGLLAGLFGMHALGPADTVAASAHHGHGAPVMSAHLTPVTDESACHSPDSGGGHAQHADPTCASSAVGAGPVLPAPEPDPAGSAVAAGLDGRSVTAAPEGGRAPPSLAELQILRT